MAGSAFTNGKWNYIGRICPFPRIPSIPDVSRPIRAGIPAAIRAGSGLSDSPIFTGAAIVIQIGEKKLSALHKSNAIILSAIRWHDSSKIITLYAREWGKIKVIAKGALRRTSPFGGKLETLN
ncbi:MAG TPA: hypothetical protein ENJ89_03250, partial [Caldithrix abyssi]|nr:hypothetical protein [Caldithrix abyssi]